MYPWPCWNQKFARILQLRVWKWPTTQPRHCIILYSHLTVYRLVEKMLSRNSAPQEECAPQVVVELPTFSTDSGSLRLQNAGFETRTRIERLRMLLRTAAWQIFKILLGITIDKIFKILLVYLLELLWTALLGR